MLLVFAIGFLVVALLMSVFIFREGKVNLTRNWSVHGAPARVIGGIIVSYVPLTIGVLVAVRAANKTLVTDGNQDLLPWSIVGVAFGVLTVLLLGCLVIALVFMENDNPAWRPMKYRRKPNPKRHYRADELEEMEEEETRRREARRRRREEDDRRPSGRRRRRDEDD